MKPQKTTEAPFQSAARILIGSRRDCMIIRVNVGVFAPIDNADRRIRSAPTGTHDLLVCQLRRLPVQRTVNPNGFNPHTFTDWVYYGQFISFETKRASGGRKSKEQLSFQAALQARGGISAFVRTEQEILDVLGPLPDWLDELPEELLLPSEK